jgi:chloride channel 3/4/5
VKQLADASQVWIILVAAGVLSGGCAAFIDVASDWLGDLKTGYCSAVQDGGGDGKFYLNKSFCCWGIEEMGQCGDWHPWGNALGIGPAGGKWVVEYIFFVMFSVPCSSHNGANGLLTESRFYLRHVRVCLCESSRRTRSIAVFLR